MRFLLLFAFCLIAEYIFIESFFRIGGIISSIGWLVSIMFILSFIVMMTFFRRKSKDYRIAFYAFGLMIFSSVPALFYLIPGLLYLVFDNSVFAYIGWAFAALIALGIFLGIIVGRWNWKVHTISPKFNNLPEFLKGKRIVQISDIHVGSFFGNKKRVRKAIQMINNQNPDYVFFTGDLVNNTADEMEEWVDVFSEINALCGKYSILGNHDYGDYVAWNNEEEKRNNFEKLIRVHEKIGFVLLRNESIKLGENTWLLGVENWGKPPFRQSGDVNKALFGVPENDFKILLSHDPSHFDEKIAGKTTISLTLSGHTHGMQFGIERFGIKWSPVSFKYSKWAGLYRVSNQFLYVNRGFGYLGFPGRVGIYPEITLIKL